jgi:muconolactone delta-isomerase
MNQYMIEFEITNDLDNNFFELIPEQRAKINALMSKGIVISYSLDTERHKLWCVMTAQSEQKVMEIINSFPLIQYMTPTITLLMFHNSVFLSIPKFSMN